MYHSCIYCSAGLGSNEALEAFPVGRSVAFDAAQGRLWALCPKCGRWNLAPIEERWEPVEAAERLFRDARLRVQSENIGLAKLRDGTRLIRVGEALGGELAAWRYGDQLMRRRRQYVMVTGAAAVVGVALAGGLAFATAGGMIFSQMGSFVSMYQQMRGRRPFHHLPGKEGAASPLVLRRWHLRHARLVPGADGSLALQIPHAAAKSAPAGKWGKTKPDPDPLVLSGADAHATLSRGSVIVNAQGANRKRVTEALELLDRAGSAEAYLRGVAGEGRRLTWEGGKPKEPTLHAPERLALEMALHEEQERRALAGELDVLQAAWRDAEEIAAIADRLALPGE